MKRWVARPMPQAIAVGVLVGLMNRSLFVGLVATALFVVFAAMISGFERTTQD